jgi:hypothetical protein
VCARILDSFLNIVDGDMEATLICRDRGDLEGQGAQLVLEVRHPDIPITHLGKDLIEHGLDAINNCHGGGARVGCEFGRSSGGAGC